MEIDSHAKEKTCVGGGAERKNGPNRKRDVGYFY